ncbi:MAG: hypothetical protein VCA36_13720 [Opitutales bacterium]
MSKTDDFARLNYLNSMLSLLSGGSTAKTEQISAVLRFLRSENDCDLLPADYDANVIQIVELHDPSKRRFSTIAHWDVRDQCVEPLWLRANLVAKLKSIEGHPSALLIVTGLRQRLCPAPKRWTKRRAASYRDVVAYVEKTALEKSLPHGILTLLFV